VKVAQLVKNHPICGHPSGEKVAHLVKSHPIDEMSPNCLKVDKSGHPAN